MILEKKSLILDNSDKETLPKNYSRLRPFEEPSRNQVREAFPKPTEKTTFEQKQEHLLKELVPDIEKELDSGLLLDLTGLDLSPFYKIHQKMKPLAADLRHHLEFRLQKNIYNQLKISAGLLENLDENSYQVWKNAQNLVNFFSINTKEIPEVFKIEEKEIALATPYGIIKKITLSQDSEHIKQLASQITDDDIAEVSPELKQSFYAWARQYIELHQGEKLEQSQDKNFQRELLNTVSVQEFDELLQSKPEYEELLHLESVAGIDLQKLLFIFKAFKHLNQIALDTLQAMTKEEEATQKEFDQVFDTYKKAYEHFSNLQIKTHFLIRDLLHEPELRSELLANHTSCIRKHKEVITYFNDHRDELAKDKDSVAFS